MSLKHSKQDKLTRLKIRVSVEKQIVRHKGILLYQKNVSDLFPLLHFIFKFRMNFCSE